MSVCMMKIEMELQKKTFLVLFNYITEWLFYINLNGIILKIEIVFTVLN